ncbi:DUF4082 domain-containing protein [Cystobacter fuscus]
MLRHASRWVTTLVVGFTWVQAGCAPAEPTASETPRTEEAARPLLPGERSLFGASAVPAVAAADDGAAVELGVRFRSDAPGRIMGVRFYKGAGNTGTHTGSLWSASGALLATATFQDETASGWQEVRFATPVAIAADTDYVASYHAPAGHYAATNKGFTSALDAPPLHAPASGTGAATASTTTARAAFPRTVTRPATTGWTWPSSPTTPRLRARPPTWWRRPTRPPPST